MLSGIDGHLYVEDYLNETPRSQKTIPRTPGRGVSNL